METHQILGAWLTVGLTLAMYTFLYGDNPVFKAAEHLYLGVTVGYAIVESVFKSLKPKLIEPLANGNWEVLIPLVLSLMILTRLFRNFSWISRWSFAAIMGYTAGLAIPTAVQQQLIAQVGDTIVPLVPQSPVPPATGIGAYFSANLPVINNAVILIGVIAVLVHFFYSVEHTGPLRRVARLGVLFLMFAFGAMFGYTTMGRMVLLFGVTHKLIEFSSPQYLYATPILLTLFLTGLIAWEWSRGGRERMEEGG